jgi:hypothetical protein
MSEFARVIISFFFWMIGVNPLLTQWICACLRANRAGITIEGC